MRTAFLFLALLVAAFLASPTGAQGANPAPRTLEFSRSVDGTPGAWTLSLGQQAPQNVLDPNQGVGAGATFSAEWKSGGVTIRVCAYQGEDESPLLFAQRAKSLVWQMKECFPVDP